MWWGGQQRDHGAGALILFPRKGGDLFLRNVHVAVRAQVEKYTLERMFCLRSGGVCFWRDQPGTRAAAAVLPNASNQVPYPTYIPLLLSPNVKQMCCTSTSCTCSSRYIWTNMAYTPTIQFRTSLAARMQTLFRAICSTVHHYTYMY